MNNTLLLALSIVLGGILCLLLLPWWAYLPLAFIAGFFFARQALRDAGLGFILGFCWWAGVALQLNMANKGILSARVGVLFAGLQTWQLLLVTGIIGALLAGLGVLSGLWTRELVFPAKKKRRYHY